MSFGVCALDNENFIFAGGLEGGSEKVKTSYIYSTSNKVLMRVGNLTAYRYGWSGVKMRKYLLWAEMTRTTTVSFVYLSVVKNCYVVKRKTVILFSLIISLCLNKALRINLMPTIDIKRNGY